VSSLIGKALAVRNQGPPVPISGSGFYGLSSLALGGAGDDREAYMRAFGTVGTVWQIVHLLASNVAKPEWRLYRKQQGDGRVRYTTNDQGSDQRIEVVRHAALSLLNTPNPWYSRFGLFEASQQYMELTGEFFWVVEYDKRATIPLGLWPVRPDRMDPVPDAKTYLRGWVYTSPDGSEKVPLLPQEVIQGRFPNPLNPYRGLGPVQSVLTEVDAARSAGEWNRNFFTNAARPDGVLQADHALSDEEWNTLTERWREAHRGVGRAHRIAVLEAGVTWVPTSSTVKDMDFPNLRNVSRDLIREAWGIHKIMLGNSDDVNRANAQTGEEVFANWSVSPRLDRWRDVLNTQFLPLFGSAGDGVEFDYVYPLPANREQDNAELMAKSQAALWLTQAGYDQADVLEAVGLPAMGATAPPLSGPSAGDAPPPADDDQALSDDAQNSLRRQVRNDAAEKVFEQQAEDYPPAAMAWMHHATWMGPVKVPLGHIDPKMPWMDGADPDHVQDFVDLLQKGKKLKPVLLVKTPSSKKLQLVDGHHRYLASAEMKQPVRAFVGTVDADEGPWTAMHKQQRGNRSSAGNRMRQLAPWNMAGVA
jgi:HK97 family phage portal protein